MRFEAPNEQNRWDCPLFKVAAIDEGKQAVVESSICSRCNYLFAT
jgi:tRNA uridine 5-carbamoylmethylation protein Kti12